MNLASGVFTAPKAGTYSFAFSAVGNGVYNTFKGVGFVYLKLNGGIIGYANSHLAGSDGYVTISIHAILKLKVGDQITLVCAAGALVDDSSTHRTHFTGILLEEDLVIS